MHTDNTSSKKKCKNTSSKSSGIKMAKYICRMKRENRDQRRKSGVASCAAVNECCDIVGVSKGS